MFLAQDIGQHAPKNHKIAIFGHSWHVFVNNSGLDQRNDKILTDMESAHPAGHCDTNKDVKIQKKYFFVKRVPPSHFFAKKNCGTT